MKLKRNHCKKTAGDGNMISSLIALLPLMLMLIFSFRIFLQMTIKQRAEWCTRKYVLSMEVEGYLTPADRSSLAQQLGQIGIRNVSFDGTTLNKARYGEPVTLVVKGKIKTLSALVEIDEKFYYQYQSTYLGAD